MEQLNDFEHSIVDIVLMNQHFFFKNLILLISTLEIGINCFITLAV